MLATQSAECEWYKEKGVRCLETLWYVGGWIAEIDECQRHWYHRDQEDTPPAPLRAHVGGQRLVGVVGHGWTALWGSDAPKRRPGRPEGIRDER
jgi:hypothetical protein